jgi:predicted patatin/cPLA2 family phospholipase
MPKKKQQKMSEAQMDAVTRSTGDELAAQPRVKVKLYQVPDASSDKPLPDETVQINGYTYVIKRGEEVEVPESVHQVLRQAGRL